MPNTMPDIMPVIKREESLEGTAASVAPMVPFQPGTADRDLSGLPPAAYGPHDVRLTMPLPAKPYFTASHTRLTEDRYHGSSPRKYKLAASPFASPAGRVVVVRAPPFARLPSRLGSAVATAGRVNKTTSTRAPNTSTTTNTHTLPHITNITKLLHRKRNLTDKNKDRMDDVFGNVGDVDREYDDGVGFARMRNNDEEEDDQMVEIPQADLANLRHQVQLLEARSAASEAKVQDQDGLIRELLTFNKHMHTSMENLNARLTSVESANTSRDLQEQFVEPPSTPAVRSARGYRSIPDGRSRSPSPSAMTYRERDGVKKSRKQLQISVPGKLYVPPGAGLPTPHTSFIEASRTARTPKTPLTPGRIGPPTSAKKPNTLISKRGYHNLDKMVPPPYAQIPLVPLTDTEIIVFFFNALARPMVSLRLYARGWGPASICDVINSHRIIEPEYLRNTVSVKCTTAIKLGRRKYGDKWEDTNRALFTDLTDDRATDNIRLLPDERLLETDYDVRALCTGLRKYPNENDGGIFTDSVKWCKDNNAAYKLSNIWEVASELHAGATPRVISSQSPEPSMQDDSLTPKHEEAAMHGDGDDAQSVAWEDSVFGNTIQPENQEFF